MARTSDVRFSDKHILMGTLESGDTTFKFKAYKIGDQVEIHTYIEKFFTIVPYHIIKMTYSQFLHQFIPILNTKDQLKINDKEISPGTWKAKEDDIRKSLFDVEMPEMMPKGGKSRRRCKRSKKRSRKTKHRRGGEYGQPASTRIQMSGW
jgi:hypothetical protein